MNHTASTKKEFSISLKVFHAFFLAVIALGITATSAIAQVGKDTGFGFCPLHKLNYQAADCPRCVADRANARNSGGNPGNTPYQPSQADIAARQAEQARLREEANRLERDRIVERERLAAELRKREMDAEFIRDRDAAANQLKGSSGSALSQLKGLSDTGSSGLKGSAFDTSSQLKPAPSANTSGLRGSGFDAGGQLKSAPVSPSGDPMVVDGRKVPTGLPPSVDTAIAEAFSAAPPGVANAVSKGYQAIMAHDWNLAQAWFGDALIKHPGDASLARLVDLARYTLQCERAAAGKTPAAAPARAAQPTSSPRDAVVDLYVKGHEAAMAGDLVGAITAFEAGLALDPRPGTTRTMVDYYRAKLRAQNAAATSTAPGLQLPTEEDIKFLFPGEDPALPIPAARPKQPVWPLLLDILLGPEKARGRLPAVASVRG